MLTCILISRFTNLNNFNDAVPYLLTVKRFELYGFSAIQNKHIILYYIIPFYIILYYSYDYTSIGATTCDSQAILSHPGLPILYKVNDFVHHYAERRDSVHCTFP